MTDFTPEEIEAGRKLFAGEWRFVAASDSLERLPPMEGVEIAFAGRSNVGKSSLVNALSNRKALARASHTPGRTQELIFFAGPRGLTITDMPGYGYAAVSKAKVKAWTALIHAYLKGRANLARVYLEQKKPALARTEVQRALKLAPNYTEAKELLDRLQSPNPNGGTP